MSKKNKTKKAILAHKLLTLISCTLETLDELKANSKDAEKLTSTINKMIPQLEEVIEGTFKRSSYLRSQTYLNDMQKRFETIIRKNYQNIKE